MDEAPIKLRTYHLNTEEPWRVLEKYADLPTETPIWVLAEQETCDPTAIPAVFRIIYQPDYEPGMKLRLLDFDPEREEEFLSGNRWSIQAWRPLTDHGGSWNAWFEEKGIDATSNWYVALADEEDDEDPFDPEDAPSPQASVGDAIKAIWDDIGVWVLMILVGWIIYTYKKLF